MQCKELIKAELSWLAHYQKQTATGSCLKGTALVVCNGPKLSQLKQNPAHSYYTTVHLANNHILYDTDLNSCTVIVRMCSGSILTAVQRQKRLGLSMVHNTHTLLNVLLSCSFTTSPSSDTNTGFPCMHWEERGWNLSQPVVENVILKAWHHFIFRSIHTPVSSSIRMRNIALAW